MDIILQGLDHVASIQDDILITGKDDDEHIKNLDSVLSRLDHYGLRLQLSKCKFMQKSVTYMGCVISASGISPTEEKVEAIKQAPRPENLTQLRAFLGMINYHGKFIRNLSSILQPLNQLLQGNQEFKWSPWYEEAFKKAKDSPFQSAEYEEFLRQNGIQRILFSPLPSLFKWVGWAVCADFQVCTGVITGVIAFQDKKSFISYLRSFQWYWANHMPSKQNLLSFRHWAIPRTNATDSKITKLPSNSIKEDSK